MHVTYYPFVFVLGGPSEQLVIGRVITLHTGCETDPAPKTDHTTPHLSLAIRIFDCSIGVSLSLARV